LTAHPILPEPGLGGNAAEAGSPTIESVSDRAVPASEPEDPRVPRVAGLIIDWGGVMTSPIPDTVGAWLAADGVDRSSYLAIMRQWVSQAYGNGQEPNPVHALERGECTDEEFERLLAAHLVRLDGQPVAPAGLLTRMFGASVADEAMHGLVRRLRGRGLRTALLSNSWGRGGYPEHLFPELFDAVVISREVGMRKPEERIFRHTVQLLGLPPGECVFIDDLEANVVAAEAVGLIGLHHREASATARRLAALLGIQLG
jgi:putative hydrolase of the HAD superfamily